VIKKSDKNKCEKGVLKENRKKHTENFEALGRIILFS
jgi:hypothetical protein